MNIGIIAMSTREIGCFSGWDNPCEHCGNTLWRRSEKRRSQSETSDHLIKQVQQEAGVGSGRVRGPRMEVDGEELVVPRAAFEYAQANHPAIAAFLL